MIGAESVSQTIPVHPVQTAFRKIVTQQLPPPQVRPLMEASGRYEPRAMLGQPPVVWDRAEGFSIYDAYGNQWLDFSSGVLITNAGHGRKEIADAIIRQTQHGLLTSYVFLNEPRVRLTQMIADLAPEPLKKVFLVSTGSETIECAIKLSRTYGRKISPDKKVIISYHHAFHGRTLGAQQIGGIPALKEWIGNLDPEMIQVPFPDGFRCGDTSFAFFERALECAGIEPKNVCGVIAETYQGGGASFGPREYFQEMRQWCDKWNVVLTFDEVQAGFGRCGRMWGFEHYGIVPDLMCLGKGISSSMPIAAVVGSAELMDLYPPGSMTSTHSGNPICCAAAVANIELIVKEKLVENAALVGEVLHQELWKQLKPYDERIGAIQGKGLVAGIQVTKPNSTEPDAELARKIVWNAVGRGLMLFSPVGFGGSTVKICPPLCITREAVIEGVGALAEAFADSVA